MKKLFWLNTTGVGVYERRYDDYCLVYPFVTFLKAAATKFTDEALGLSLVLILDLLDFARFVIVVDVYSGAAEEPTPAVAVAAVELITVFFAL